MKIQNLSVPDCAKALVPQMRDWVKECSWADIQDDYDVDGLADEEILLGVERFYDGGIDAFVRDNQPANTNEELVALLETALPYLRSCVSYSPEATDAYNQAVKAIAKAKGARQ